MPVSELDAEILTIFTGEHNEENIKLVESNRNLFDDNEYFPGPLYEHFKGYTNWRNKKCFYYLTHRLWKTKP